MVGPLKLLRYCIVERRSKNKGEMYENKGERETDSK